MTVCETQIMKKKNCGISFGGRLWQCSVVSEREDLVCGSKADGISDSVGADNAVAQNTVAQNISGDMVSCRLRFGDKNDIYMVDIYSQLQADEFGHQTTHVLSLSIIVFPCRCPMYESLSTALEGYVLSCI